MPYFSLKSDKTQQQQQNYPNTLETTFFAYALLQDTLHDFDDIDKRVYTRFFPHF